MNSGLIVGHRRPPAPASDLDRVADALDVYSFAGRDVTTDRREEVTPRMHAQTGVGLSTQVLRLAYGTARRTTLIRNVKTFCQSAHTLASLCRIGMYFVDINDSLVLVAAVASDTTMWSANSTSYTRGFSSPFIKPVGQRYAVGFLCVTAGTAPQVGGSNMNLGDLAADTPKLAGAISAQADLPATIASASTGTTGNMPFAELLP